MSNHDLLSRQVAANKARQILGIRESFYLGLPDNRLDSLPLIEIIQSIEPIISDINPSIVYTHHCGDLNVDHRITHQVVLTACRPLPTSSVREIYAFEIMSSTEWATPSEKPFLPNHYVNIERYLATKLEAAKAYEVEMREAPHSRSIEHLTHLAYHRGHSVGFEAAEAFMMVRACR